MANILFATTARVDAGTLTAGGTLADTLPIANLQAQQPGQVARWTSLTGMYVVADLLEAAAINLVALLAHNGTSAATWRIRAAATEADLTAAPGFDTGAVFESVWPSSGRPSPGYDDERLHSIRYLSPAQSFRYWRIDVEDAANPAGYFEAGRLVIDAAWQPERNLRHDWDLGHDDPAEPRLAALGHLWPGPESRPARVFECAVRGMTEDDAANGYEILRRRGRRGDLLVVRNPELTTHLQRNVVYGLLLEPGRVRRIAHNYYEQPFKLREFPV